MREHKGLGDDARITLTLTKNAILPPVYGRTHTGDGNPRATYYPDAITHDDDAGLLTLSFNLPEPEQRPAEMNARFSTDQKQVRFSFSTDHIINIEEAY